MVRAWAAVIEPISRIKPRLVPGCAETVAPEHNTVVQAERALLPELDRDRHDPVAGPIGRTRDFADGIFRRIDGDRLFEGEAALQRRGLLARPGPDLCLLGA